MGTASMGCSFFREHAWRTWDRLRIVPIRSIEIVGGKAIPMLALNVCQQLLAASPFPPWDRLIALEFLNQSRDHLPVCDHRTNEHPCGEQTLAH